MPQNNITADEFVAEVWEDYNSPTTSNFLKKLGVCRSTVSALEEVEVRSVVPWEGGGGVAADC